jgi:hypothetical protein
LNAALEQGDFALVESSANAMLPRARNMDDAHTVEPVRDGDETVLDNGLLHVRLSARGALLECTSPRVRAPITQANIVTGLGRSASALAFELRQGEPFLRAGMKVERSFLPRTVRLENWLAIAHPRVRYGIDGRLAAIEDDFAGLAIFVAPDTVWKERALRKGGIHVRADLARGRDAAELAWAFAPYEAGISLGALERAWESFALPPRVRLFTSEDPAILVNSCRPDPGGEGVLVSVRECDGVARQLRLRSGARATKVEAVGGGEAALDGEAIVAPVDAFGTRIFRVRF